VTKYLITPSLINSFSYYMKDEWKSPQDSRADFLKTLSRERFEPNEAMQKGIDFEYLVEKTCNWNSIDWPKLLSSKCEKLKSLSIKDIKDALKFVEKKKSYIASVEEIGRIVKSGLWQERVKKDITIGEHDFILYGRCDVIKRDTIYDIKFTKSYETSKFQDSIQHLIYLYCSGLPKFSYLISDGKDWWQEDYFNNNNVEAEICLKISDFMGYLENDIEAKEMFLNKWRSK